MLNMLSSIEALAHGGGINPERISENSLSEQ